MLEVLPIQTKLEQEAICARCGVTYKADCMAYHALVDGNLTAVCQFTMDSEGGHIHDLAMVRDVQFTDRDRIESLFVMGRATLNFIDLCGVHTAYFEDEGFEGEGMIKSIGFTKTSEGRWFVDLTDFFVEPCQHGHGLKQD
ncbi:MAG: hypothetical protein E7610_01630 [Ruminococcaceae bacterium]|nr:hypothetical protein [Oscillospiraceae bacterium]